MGSTPPVSKPAAEAPLSVLPGAVPRAPPLLGAAAAEAGAVAACGGSLVSGSLERGSTKETFERSCCRKVAYSSACAR